MLKPSTEQQMILDNLKEKNVVVNSVAGSGKTTTNIFIAKTFLNKNILLLTYNTKLRFETKERLEKNNITNMIVFTYHAFCVQYYTEYCKNDQELEDLLTNNPKPKKEINFDIIILDEAQDITPILFQLVCKINSDNNMRAKICVLGDENQSIYGYNGADKRYITLADKLYKFNNLLWCELKLSESYRITKQMSEFINKCCLGYDRIIAKKEGIKPIYIHRNIFSMVSPKTDYEKENSLINKILSIKDKYNYSNEDIFILAPSVKISNITTPIKLLANAFTNESIPIFIPNSDEERIDKMETRNKVLFSSFHQAKGMERKLVVVFEFNQNYFNYYAKDDDSKSFTNPLYVATTRASEILILLHDYKQPFFHFLDEKILYDLVDYDGYNSETDINNKINNLKKNEKIFLNKDDVKRVYVTSIVKNISYSFYKKILQFVDIQEIQPKSIDVINIRSKTKQKNTLEDVAEINGDVVHLYFEYKTKGRINCIDNELYDYIQNSRNERYYKYKNGNIFGKCKLDKYPIQKIINNEKCWGNLLAYIVNHHNSKKTDLKYQIQQITKYKWLQDHLLYKCFERLSKQISINSKHELHLIENINIKKTLSGYIDIIDNNNNTIWEIKAVTELSFTHKLQLILYMCMVEKYKIKNNIQHKYKYKLFNVKDDQIFEISATPNNINNVYNMIINYTNATYNINNKQFLINNVNLYSLYKYSLK